MTEDRTIDKIRKLLAMGKDERGNETERETALRQAYSLLAKHNLTVADVGSTQTAEKREQQIARLSVFPWARGIAHSIADLFFCSYYFQRGAGKLANHSFVGKASNAVTASEMSTYVISNVFKELRARFGSETHPHARNFATGAETAIRMRCNAMRREAEQAQQPAAASTGTALMLVDVYKSEKNENTAWIAGHVGKLVVATDRTKATGGDAYRAGKEHGATISLNRQVSGGKSGALRIK